MKGKRRYFAAGCAVAVSGAILIFYCVVIETNLISTDIVDIANDDLFDIFREKKVVQISDLHITSIGYREKRLVRILNEIKPDIIFVTGDFLTNGKGEESCIEVLRNIKMPPYGIWAVLGNTDRYKEDGLNRDIKVFLSRLRKLGIKVLENSREIVNLDDNEKHLYVLGVEGKYFSRSKLDWLLRGIPRSSPVIVLSHYPDILEDHADALVINLEDAEGMGISGWGWQDDAFFEYDRGIIRFEKSGPHTLRVQRREDGVVIEQICLVNDTGGNVTLSVPLGKVQNNSEGMYSTINPNSNEMIIIKADDISDSDIFGCWEKVVEPTVGVNPVLKDMPDLGIKKEFPEVKPEHYFEASFYAKGGIDYHVWIRMKAENDLISSDSVYLQFSDSINQQGEPIYRIDQYGVRHKLTEIDLILAGHTHGGQVRIPVIGALPLVPGHRISKYDMGLFESQGSRMYVNRGIGTTMLPVRFMCRPEITLFRFTKMAKS